MAGPLFLCMSAPVSVPGLPHDVSPKPMREAFFLARIANFISNALMRLFPEMDSGDPLSERPPSSYGHSPEIAVTRRGKEGGPFYIR
jgi:hypothetical protein